MLFNSPVFLFLFLPVTFILYVVGGTKFRNIILLLASILFYAWGTLEHSIIIIISIIVNYFVGVSIGKSNDYKKRKFYLIVGLIANLGLLFVFKYANFVIDNINVLISVVHIKTLDITRISLPIGISFFTFQAISYIVDVYRKETKPQNNIIDLALFISLFPQLIAGPIVRYHDIALQLKNRKHTIRKFSSGVERFVLGLVKKILLANSFALVADTIFSLPAGELNILNTWLATIAYAFQIYFDFSGYSDMAIGLGRMFGFELLENFNFPYISKSIKEFWRRWHISLSTWFKDYLYIPLGGSRGKIYQTYRNLFVVFLLTGFWHGASWNFMIWGFFHGFFIVIERVGFNKILKKVPSVFQHFYLLFIVLIGWVFFRADTLFQSTHFIKIMLGISQIKADYKTIAEFFTPDFIIILIVGILSSTTIFLKLNALGKHFENILSERLLIFFKGLYRLLYVCGVIFLFILSLSYMASDSYNPFIYFRF